MLARVTDGGELTGAERAAGPAAADALKAPSFSVSKTPLKKVN